jgi:hypothetical protein
VSSLEHALSDYRAKLEHANIIYEYKLQELRQQEAQSQEERIKLGLAMHNLQRRFAGKKQSLLQKRDALIRHAEEKRAERLQEARDTRQVMRAERLAIWERYRATGNEQQAIEELQGHVRVIFQQNRKTALTKPTAPESWWQNLRRTVATIISRRKSDNEESSHVQG